MKKHFATLAIASALLAGTAAYAQDPAATPHTPGMDTTVTTTTTTDETGGMIVGGYEDPNAIGTMPATGGAPLAMALAGTLTAAGAFLIRRKLS